MRTLCTLVVALTFTAGLAAQQKPDAKPADPKAAPAIAGKWTMSVETDGGPMESSLELKAGEGKKVSGTITSQMGSAPIEGEFAEGKLTLSMTMEGSGGSMAIAFSGTMKEDGTLAGTLNGGNGQFTLSWTAKRVKDK